MRPWILLLALSIGCAGNTPAEPDKPGKPEPPRESISDLTQRLEQDRARLDQQAPPESAPPEAPVADNSETELEGLGQSVVDALAAGDAKDEFFITPEQIQLIYNPAYGSVLSAGQMGNEKQWKLLQQLIDEDTRVIEIQLEEVSVATGQPYLQPTRVSPRMTVVCEAKGLTRFIELDYLVKTDSGWRALTVSNR